MVWIWSRASHTEFVCWIGIPMTNPGISARWKFGGFLGVQLHFIINYRNPVGFLQQKTTHVPKTPWKTLTGSLSRILIVLLFGIGAG
jgi:hypothetical protein